jgi:endonuclease/exonuclease/phosphatase family metal-dependent hydrolase
MKKLLLIIFLASLLLPSNGQFLKLMTYNIRFDNPNDGANKWNLRKEFLAKQIQFYSPEILGIQEGLFHQLEYLDSALANYNYIGVGRDDGKQDGEYCAIFFNAQKLSLLEHSTFWLSETPNNISKGWDAVLERICTYALFKCSETKKLFWVFNTHLDHIGTEARQKSAELIWAKINEFNTNGYPVILLGDFNSTPTSKPIIFLSSVMQETFNAAGFTFGPPGTFNGFDFCKPVTHHIDFIFASKFNIIVQSHAILSDSYECKYPSDHLPVLVKVFFEP